MDRLKDKVALITGGTSGIGAATAALFHAEGAQVIATGSSEASVETARRQMPGITFIHSDAADPEAAKQLIEQVRRNHGRLDVLFVNAGIARLSTIEAMDEAVFDKVLGVNFRGPYFLIKHAAALLVDGGSIVLTSSLAGVRGIAQLSAYGASKAALRSLGLSLAAEFSPRRIRINTITPGPIATEMGSKMEVTPDQAAGSSDFASKVLLGRMGRPEEIAAAALYFASEDSHFTTGAELVIDGGYTVQ
ncbi:SDR family NAD(P)-dependent oxidoreductase [Terriglobus sp.]|uniref:SDR family NAD(P)-dependent oxidoreductase n=1 Tax=Terriglobus sp. TaxID=1889013 RepID=UPI003B0049FB